MQASVGCKGMIMELSSPWVTIKFGISLEFSSLITIVKFLVVQDVSVQKVYIPCYSSVQKVYIPCYSSDKGATIIHTTTYLQN